MRFTWVSYTNRSKTPMLNLVFATKCLTDDFPLFTVIDQLKIVGKANNIRKPDSVKTTDATLPSISIHVIPD